MISASRRQRALDPTSGRFRPCFFWHSLVSLVLALDLDWLRSAHAQASPASVTAASGSGAAAQPFDVKAAVDAYLARVPADQRARSDAYFEGGYWLLLWDFLSTVVVMWMLLRFRWSVRMRDLAERLTRFKALQAALYWVQFVVVFAVIVFPLTVYEGYFREHKYGLSNQTFWAMDARPGGRAGGGGGAGRPPGGALVWRGQAAGQELVGVGKRVSVIVFTAFVVVDCAGFYFSAVQQVHQAGGPALQGCRS